VAGTFSKERCVVRSGWIGVLSRAVTVSLVLLPAGARADLGGDARSVERDRAKMKASLVVRPMGRYAVHEMTSASGTRVREFATPEGRIFAVAWQGPFHPDYQQLLGSYFPRLQQATGQRRARRAPVVIEAPGFVFQLTGHLRGLAGRAWVPELLPAGVGVEDIQ
jgi:hypothetical protein